jgi:hypothetical protein
MLSAAWVIPYLAHRLGPGDSWRCLFAYRGGNLVGALPVIVTPQRVPGTTRPLLQTPWDFHTRSGDFLLASGEERPVLTLLLQALRLEIGPWFSLCVRGVVLGSPTSDLIERPPRGFAAVAQPSEPAAVFPVARTQDDSYARLSKNFRNNLRKARNRLKQLPGVVPILLSGPRADRASFHRFVDLESAGWKGAEGSAIKNSPSLLSFYEDLTGRLGALGCLEFHFLEAEGQLLAGGLAVRMGGALVLMKIAYNEAYSRCAPGNMLFEQTVLHAIEAGDIREINCLALEGWHRNWGMVTRAYSAVRLYPRNLVSLSLGELPLRAHLRLRNSRLLGPAYRSVRKALSGEGLT